MVLPFDYTDYATQIREYFTEAMKLARIDAISADRWTRRR